MGARASPFGIRLAVVVLVALAISATRARADPDIWGVKSKAPASSPPNSEPPAHLFHFPEGGGGSVTDVGVIKIGTTSIDVDGLAMTLGGALYAFEVGTSGSRLISVDSSTAAASVIGTGWLNCDIRGAVFTQAGTLLTVDSQNDQLVQINPADGTVVSSIGLFQSDGATTFNLSDSTDIAQRADGTFMLGDLSTLYSLSTSTGVVSSLHTDNSAQFVGLAFPATGTNLAALSGLEVAGADDIYAYQTDAGFERTTLYDDIISSYNAGRGDLASVPIPEPFSMAFIGSAFVGVVACRLRKRRKEAKK